MRRPSFQFYPADWLGNSNLRRCTHAEKGAWIDVMCLMNDSDEYGLLRWPLEELAQAIGAQVEILRALVAKGVMRGADDECEAFTYTPRHGRKNGDPVTLIPVQRGPVWYSSRMVRDEYVRQHRGDSSRFGASGEGKECGANDAPMPTPKVAPMPTPKDAPMPSFVAPIPSFGDGSTSTSASKNKPAVPSSPLNPKEIIFDLGVSILTKTGTNESGARSFLAKFAKQDEGKLAEVVGYLAANPKVEPKAYIAAAFKPEARGLVI